MPMRKIAERYLLDLVNRQQARGLS